MADEQVVNFLEHHGIKGQKWGIRNQRNLDRVSRVARGTASRSDKLHVLNKQSALSLVRGHGLTGAAKRDMQRLTAQKKLIQSGEATTRDLLSVHGAALFNMGRASAYGTSIKPKHPSIKIGRNIALGMLAGGAGTLMMAKWITKGLPLK